jgi:hypothetical protein
MSTAAVETTTATAVEAVSAMESAATVVAPGAMKVSAAVATA